MNVVENKTVVVTGASSGIGRACVLRLVQSGWRVFATVRKLEDGNRLQSEVGAGLTPLMMDVTNRASVTAAAEQLACQVDGRGLDGLVNVAGIGMVRPVECGTPSDLQTIFDINVFGQIAVTQAFLPLLRTARGRAVNISSVGAHIAIHIFGLLVLSGCDCPSPRSFNDRRTPRSVRRIPLHRYWSFLQDQSNDCDVACVCARPLSPDLHFGNCRGLVRRRRGRAAQSDCWPALLISSALATDEMRFGCKICEAHYA